VVIKHLFLIVLLQKIYKIYLDSSLQQLIINYANFKAFLWVIRSLLSEAVDSV